MSENDSALAVRLFGTYSDAAVTEARRSKKSFANDAYFLATEEGSSYVLRILRTQTKGNAEVEAHIQAHLAERGIATSRYEPMKDGSPVGFSEGKYFTVAPFIKGESPASFSPKLIQSFGTTLAKLHNALDGIDIPKNDVQWLDPINARRDLEACPERLKPVLTATLEETKDLFDRDLPRAVIHGDLWVDNVFAENDEITTVFDFETAEYTIRLLDLIRTEQSLVISSDLPREAVRKLLQEGYDTVASKPLAHEEFEAWNLAERFVAGACVIWCSTHGAEEFGEAYLSFI